MTAPRFGAQLSGQTGWSLAAAGFSNPQYIGPPIPNYTLSDSTGFDVAAGAGVLIYFSGTYTGQTLVHEQTLDPLGLTGWFQVFGQVVSNAPTTPSASFSTSGQCYQFPAAGVRHRITVSALSTGTIVVFVALVAALISLNASGGGGGSSTGATATAANPTYSEGATNQPLSVTLFGAQRAVIYDAAGVALDYTLAAPVAGIVSDDSPVSTTKPVLLGGRAASTNRTAVADADLVAIETDLKGRTVTTPFQVRELSTASAVVTLTSTTETTLLAAVASTFNDMVWIKLNNTSGSAVRVDIRSTTGGTVIDTWYLPIGDVRGMVFTTPFKQAAANTNWTVQLSGAVTDVRITAGFVANT